MTFDVEIVIKGQSEAVTDRLQIPHGEVATWTEAAAYDALTEILRAIDRAQNPAAPRDRVVALTGFSWIVEPSGDQVVLAIEIPMGAAVAGPFTADAAAFEALITRTIHLERLKTPRVVH